jgi:parallel beta-helix repeat protein
MSGLNVTLPNDVIVGVAYNTADYGAAKLNTPGPYNSLNVGAPNGQTASVGTDDNTDNVFWNTSFAGFYTDHGAAGVGVFRQDTNWTPNGTVAIQITASATCMPTGFMRDGINMTAAQIGGDVTGELDATGCNIGVYYDNTHSGNVTNANIHGSNYFGVVVNGDVGAVNTNVTGSTIHDIGETPLNGTQHGNAIYYRAFGGSASGTISGNTLTNYQKGGITVNGNVSATITNNTVTGQGPVNYIAQNGIQLGYGAKATVTGNTVTGNAYTGANGASSGGILVVGGECFGAGLAYTVGADINRNTLTGNDVGIFLDNADASCNVPATRTNNSMKFNTISNGAVTNATGESPTCGYQAGISDVGTKDQIVNNSISGLGYTPVSGDCPFLRFIDASSSARGVGSNK